MEESKLPIDRGWAWFVMLACFGLNLTNTALALSFGVLLVDLQEKFQSSAWAITTTQGTSIALWLGLAPVANALAIRFNNRNVMFFGGVLGTIGFMGSSLVQSMTAFFFLRGIIVGIGFGLSYAPCIVALMEYFRRFRGLAVSFAFTGTPVGTAVLPIFIRWLATHYGLQGSILVQGAMMAHVCAFAMLVRPKSFYNNYTHLVHKRGESEIAESMERSSEGIKESEFTIITKLNLEDSSEAKINQPFVDNLRVTSESDPYSKQLKLKMENMTKMRKSNCFRFCRTYFDWTALRNPVFDIYLIACLLSASIANTALMTLPSKALSVNYSQEEAGRVITFYSVASLISRIFIGAFTDFFHVRRKYVYSATVIFASVTALNIPFATNDVSFTALCVCLGFSGGILLTTGVLVLAELGQDRSSSAVSILLLSEAIGTAAFAQIVGKLRDVTGNWNASFWLMGSLGIFTGLLTLVFPIVKLWKKLHTLTANTRV